MPKPYARPPVQVRRTKPALRRQYSRANPPVSREALEPSTGRVQATRPDSPTASASRNPSTTERRTGTSLVFLPPEQTEAVRSLLCEYALREHGDEPGAATHRFKAVSIDWTRGTATGYVAKYVAKNIDGYGLGADSEKGQPAKRSVEHVDAWASTWRCRKFQFFGSPPVTVWRELRRVVDPDDGTLVDLAAAADAGDWKAFLTLMGGPGATRAEHTARPLMCWSDESGRYDEPKGNSIIGVATADVEVITRHHTWRLDYKRNQESAETRAPYPSRAEERSVPLTPTRDNNRKGRVAATCGSSVS